MSIQHLDGSRKKAREWDISLFEAHVGSTKAFDHVDGKPSTEGNERRRSRQTAPGTDLKTVGATQFTSEAGRHFF